MSATTTVNWLHLSDLHFGLDAGSWLWPQMKHAFVADINSLGERIGPWDVVFFTGDLTQCGTAEQFARLERELRDLMEKIAPSQPPKLFVVPGNHDVVRPIRKILMAYAYLHGQRFSSLLDDCHESLWTILRSQNDTTRMLRLFRHSSFIWRLRGEDGKEKASLEQLEALETAKGSEEPRQERTVEVLYFAKRLRDLLNRAVGL